jgi:alcohol dehydrogenase, propanol-preferring
MRAMVLDGVGGPLRPTERPLPQPSAGQLLIRVLACGVCRTDLHLLDGEVTIASPPRVLGHQIVGVVESGSGPETGDRRRVGVSWLGWTCGECAYCTSGRENLCPSARFTGRDIDGGMAEFAVADERYCFPILERYPSEQAAPLLCAGAIGYRALRMCGEASRVGLYGFGAAAHILAQICRWEDRRVFAFTRAGDETAQSFALELGADWAGESTASPPEALDAASSWHRSARSSDSRCGRSPLAVRWCAPAST